MERHEALKKKIHGFRMPIQNKFGLFGVGVVYFSIPLVAGYFIMEWSNRVRDVNLGEGQRERLLAAKAKWQAGTGTDTPTIVMAQTPKPKKVDIQTPQL